VSSHDAPEESRFAIDIDPTLRQRVEAAAAERCLSVRDYVISVLREALESDDTEQPAEQPGEWSRLSIPSFARDWSSDVDAIYDDVAVLPSHPRILSLRRAGSPPAR
jgi:hypothetical protein